MHLFFLALVACALAYPLDESQLLDGVDNLVDGLLGGPNSTVAGIDPSVAATTTLSSIKSISEAILSSSAVSTSISSISSSESSIESLTSSTVMNTSSSITQIASPTTSLSFSATLVGNSTTAKVSLKPSLNVPSTLTSENAVTTTPIVLSTQLPSIGQQAAQESKITTSAQPPTDDAASSTSLADISDIPQQSEQESVSEATKLGKVPTAASTPQLAVPLATISHSSKATSLPATLARPTPTLPALEQSPALLGDGVLYLTSTRIFVVTADHQDAALPKSSGSETKRAGTLFAGLTLLLSVL